MRAPHIYHAYHDGVSYINYYGERVNAAFHGRFAMKCLTSEGWAGYGPDWSMKVPTTYLFIRPHSSPVAEVNQHPWVIAVPTRNIEQLPALEGFVSVRVDAPPILHDERPEFFRLRDEHLRPQAHPAWQFWADWEMNKNCAEKAERYLKEKFERKAFKSILEWHMLACCMAKVDAKTLLLFKNRVNGLVYKDIFNSFDAIVSNERRVVINASQLMNF
ncbi:hypothetical protein M011DRAFT_477255 [Sporormia fimetaria CBS 119925]|uniref:Uncharacterized protein n=1 Tax=Sporormia fimetaria CBS 119925 TaxID=1340428 RepID=A0A6A6VEV7_9PLEO|nr:hypothetical protein M011DRAFT_477255 [Sporormia fimetaria CBS 119925]